MSSAHSGGLTDDLTRGHADDPTDDDPSDDRRAQMTSLTVVAQAAEPSLFGWYLGMGIGAAVVLVVVIVVGSILSSAARIAKQAGTATEALDDAYRNTLPLWDVAAINRSARGILEDARTARQALGG